MPTQGHCTPTAKAHHRAQRAHKNAANHHEAHAQSNPIGADFHNSIAQQHRTEAKVHPGYKSIYSALSSKHDRVALDDPSHLSIQNASDSHRHAEESQRDARRSRARTKGSWHYGICRAHGFFYISSQSLCIHLHIASPWTVCTSATLICTFSPIELWIYSRSHGLYWI